MASATPADPLDAAAWTGQRSATFRFDLVDGRTGQRRGQLTPLRSSAPTLSHDTTATISRRVNGLVLGVDDTARIRSLTDRVEIAMVVAGRAETAYPLGRYLIADDPTAVSTAGPITTLTLYDEMFIVDQELEGGFDAAGRPVDVAVASLLDGLPIGDVVADATDQNSVNSWSPGTSRAGALNDLATTGGYFKPWFDNRGRLRLLRAFEPADRQPTIDLDRTQRVIRDSISQSSELLTAPNRFVVVSNDLGDGTTTAVIGTYDVPSSAPHSISQRGFVLPRTVEAQVTTVRQAQVYARTYGLQQTVYEVVELSTPADPRHDGYDVVLWEGARWLETGWEMQLQPGGQMRHTLRRAYPNADGETL